MEVTGFPRLNFQALISISSAVVFPGFAMADWNYSMFYTQLLCHLFIPVTCEKLRISSAKIVSFWFRRCQDNGGRRFIMSGRCCCFSLAKYILMEHFFINCSDYIASTTRSITFATTFLTYYVIGPTPMSKNWEGWLRLDSGLWKHCYYG